jgi:hypothetical protein
LWLVNRGQSYGEWAEPDDVRCFIIKDFIFPHPEESTAYTTLCMEYMAEIAQYLGKKKMQISIVVMQMVVELRIRNWWRKKGALWIQTGKQN